MKRICSKCGKENELKMGMNKCECGQKVRMIEDDLFDKMVKQGIFDKVEIED